jgi:hypothetical protein
VVVCCGEHCGEILISTYDFCWEQMGVS